MEDVVDKIYSKISELWNTFRKSRGEWNDGYLQGIQDCLAIVTEAKYNSVKYSNNNTKNSDFMTMNEIENFKKNYFKKGFQK